MKQKIALAVALLVVGAIAFMGWRVWRGAAAKRATAERIQTLPAFEARALGGGTVSEKDVVDGRPLVLVYFRTTCHFCQGETKSIAAHEALREAAPVVMVSSEPRAAVEQFAEKFGLAQLPNVRLARDEGGRIAETFGVGAVPATFVYGADGRLLEHFRGEASAEAIYAALQGEGTGRPADAEAADTAAGGCAMSATLAEADTTSDCLPNEH